MMGVFAEFERAMIQERIKARLLGAKAQGKRLGRPTMAPDIEGRILSLLEQGVGKLKIAKTLGIGVSVVQRLMA